MFPDVFFSTSSSLLRFSTAHTTHGPTAPVRANDLMANSSTTLGKRASHLPVQSKKSRSNKKTLKTKTWQRVGRIKSLAFFSGGGGKRVSCKKENHDNGAPSVRKKKSNSKQLRVMRQGTSTAVFCQVD